MSSSFSRTFSFTAGMILLSIILLGTSFCSLFYNYTIREQKNSLSTGAEAVAEYVGSVSSLDEIDNWNDRLTITYGAGVSGTDVLLCDTEGEVMLCSCGSLYCEHLGRYVSDTLLHTAVNSGSAYARSSLDGIYENERFAWIVPIYSSQTSLQLGYAIVSSETEDVSDMMLRIFELFMLTACVVLVIALLFTGIFSRRRTRTLRQLSGAARQFAHGDFNVRIETDEYDDDDIADLANAFNNMASSLQRSENLRQEFISNVSHELKTPMTTIGGFMDGMLDGTIPKEKYRYYMQTVSDEVKRLSRLVRSMLDISRLQATGEEILKARFSLSEAIGRTLLSFEQRIEEKELDVQVDMPEKDIYVMANEDAITQVIYNLIENAVKFADVGTPLEITLRVSGGKANVSIANTGPTISPEELPLLFDRFHKSDKSRSMDKTGVGLGLYIVKTILGTHGEDITVTSREGLTTFTFTLTTTK